MRRNWKDESRMDYGRETDGGLTREEVQTGAIMRIADALETIAKDRVNLEQEVTRWKRWHGDEQLQRRELERRIPRIQGAATRKQRKLEARIAELEGYVEKLEAALDQEAP